MPIPYLSIIIPNYNEMANLQSGALDKVIKYLKKAKFTWEVIISDDNSTDGSREFIEKYIHKQAGFTLLHNSHTGKAGALKNGIARAKGKYILFADMDQSTPLSEVEKLLPWFSQGFNVVIGSRGQQRNSSLFRQIVSRVFFTFRRSVLLSDIVDTQCGFKAFETKTLKNTFPKLSNFDKQGSVKGWVVSAFDVELLFMLCKKGENIKEVNVNWKDEDTSTSKPRNFAKESIDMVRQLMRVKLRDIQGEYENTTN